MMMKQWSRLIVGFVSLLVAVPALHSQAVHTADRTTRIQAGVGVLALNPDYTDAKVVGLSAWGDYDFSKYVGAEVSMHFENIITSTDIAEDSYLIGPRFSYRHKGLTAYAKTLVGRGTITNQLLNLSSSYNIYAFGGGLEYKLGRRWNVRVLDFEQEEWPSFRPHTLGPTAVTIGLSYIIH